MSDTENESVSESENNGYEEQEEEYNIIVCSQCKCEISTNEQYEQYDDGIALCVECYNLMDEQEQIKNNSD